VNRERKGNKPSSTLPFFLFSKGGSKLEKESLDAWRFWIQEDTLSITDSTSVSKDGKLTVNSKENSRDATMFRLGYEFAVKRAIVDPQPIINEESCENCKNEDCKLREMKLCINVDTGRNSLKYYR